MATKAKAAAAAAEGPALKRARTASVDRFPVPRSAAPRRPPPSSGNFRVVTWNVCTLRSLLDKHQSKLTGLVDQEKPDLLLLQETKLKKSDEATAETKLRGLLKGYSFHFSSSEVKQGYSGSMAAVHERSPAINVTFGVPSLPAAGEANREGRTITVEYEGMYVVGSYVPNSGQQLQRLDFRTKEWDRAMETYLRTLEVDKPVLWVGDLNVAHEVPDIYNAGGIKGIPLAKHLEKTAGCTKRERDSFTELLKAGKFVDLFRHQHPEATGWYSYWSIRAGNLAVNRGLRLDYAVASKSFIEEGGEGPKAIDTAIIPDFVVDHAPVSCTLAI
eukprot:Hpha_TRINITY_DN163_c0_g1::TRINITY_DN163_c0_g1_i1::g.82385::m.82385